MVSIVGTGDCGRDDDDGDDDCGKNRNDGNNNNAPFTDGEFLIVACDGLWDVMEDQEAVDFVRNYVGSAKKEYDDGEKTACRREETVASFLIEEALRRQSNDNITVIVYWL